jgi:predicted acylesterase/phospholipase RssA
MEDKNIKSIVVSGGGHTFITFYGVIKESKEKGFWNYENIESLYGTSAGAMTCILIALNIDDNILDNYLMKRPWDKVFNINVDSFVTMVNSFGLFNKEKIYDFFGPLLDVKEFSRDITLKEFYEINKIHLNIYTTELNSFEYINLSHITHPDWKLIDAVYASITLPLIFSPIFEENKCYIDGGVLMDFAISDCLEKHNENEIFAIKKKTSKLLDTIDSSSNIMTFTYTLLKKCIDTSIPKYNSNIKYIINIEGTPVTIEDILKVTCSQELRYKMANEGRDAFNKFNDSCSGHKGF